MFVLKKVAPGRKAFTSFASIGAAFFEELEKRFGSGRVHSCPWVVVPLASEALQQPRPSKMLRESRVTQAALEEQGFVVGSQLLRASDQLRCNLESFGPSGVLLDPLDGQAKFDVFFGAVLDTFTVFKPTEEDTCGTHA